MVLMILGKVWNSNTMEKAFYLFSGKGLIAISTTLAAKEWEGVKGETIQPP